LKLKLYITFIMTISIGNDHAGTDYKFANVETKKSDFGILICGSANGVAMTANKHQGIRAGLCWNKEIVHLIRSHNNANILCIPARFTAIQQVIEMVDVFFNTEFEGGRHQTRIDKIPVSC